MLQFKGFKGGWDTCMPCVTHEVKALRERVSLCGVPRDETKLCYNSVKVWGRINGMFIRLKESHPISRSSLNLEIW